MELDLSRGNLLTRNDALSADGFRIQRIETRVLPACAVNDPAGRERIDVVWEYAPTEAQQWVIGYARADFDHKAQELFSQGWGLHAINTYNYDDQVIYNAVWRKVPNQQAIWGYSWGDFKKKAQEMHDLGFTMTVVDSVETTNGVNYSAAWERSSGLATYYVIGYAPADFSSLYDQLRRAGWNLVGFNSSFHSDPDDSSKGGIDASWEFANNPEERATGLTTGSFSQKQVDMASRYRRLISFIYAP
jgi:hypothetical protein